MAHCRHLSVLVRRPAGGGGGAGVAGFGLLLVS